jgi:hypothetical protein
LGHFAATSYIDRALKLAGVLVCVLVLGGCGAVEFEGKIFDYMGVSGTPGQEADVQMSARPDLMLPPNLNTLPQPGTGATATARQDWPDDPERVRKRVATVEAKKKAEQEAELDPLNPYAGKETLLDKLFKRDKPEEEPIVDVPEPDPSDRLPQDNAVADSRPKPLTPHVPQAPLPDRNDEAFKPANPGSYGNVSSGQNDAAAF